MKDSKFKGNIAYIQEVLLHEALETDTFYDFDEVKMINDYSIEEY